MRRCAEARGRAEARRHVKRALARAEETVPVVALAAMMALPLGEAVVRKFFAAGIPGARTFVQHLTLVVAFPQSKTPAS